MKKQSTTLFAQLGESAMKSLTNIVDEKLAFDIEPTQPKIFTAAELWNIQRQKKAITRRRFNF